MATTQKIRHLFKIHDLNQSTQCQLLIVIYPCSTALWVTPPSPLCIDLVLLNISYFVFQERISASEPIIKPTDKIPVQRIPRSAMSANRHPCMQYGPLGNTDMTVSRLGLGGAPLGWCYGSVDETEAINTVREAIKAGVNYLDTAPWCVFLLFFLGGFAFSFIYTMFLH